MLTHLVIQLNENSLERIAELSSISETELRRLLGRAKAEKSYHHFVFELPVSTGKHKKE